MFRHLQAPLTLAALSGLMIFLFQPFLMYALTLHVQAKININISLWKTHLYVYLHRPVASNLWGGSF